MGDQDGEMTSSGYDPPILAVRQAVALALAEDLLPLGDATAKLVPGDRSAQLHIVSREDGIVAGGVCAVESFHQVDSSIAVDWKIPDGGRITRGSVVAEVAGPLRSILTAERTALNFLCHLSGVATLAGRFVEAVSRASQITAVLDTRKTTPGLRALEKAAVRAGGGKNHRGNLSEAVLVKDNHLVGSSITEVVARARELWPFKLVEVECDTMEQAIKAQDAGATMVLLDNLTPDEVAACVVALRSRAGGKRVLVEVSGGVTLETAPLYAAAGTDFISVGALTHSSPAVDLGLDIPVAPAG